MRKSTKLLIPTLFALALAAPPSTARAADVGGSHNFGVGLVLGYPEEAGFSLNVFMGPHTSLQIDPIFRFHHDYSYFGGRVDLLFWNKIANLGSAADFVWFVGPGGRLLLFSDYYYDHNHYYRNGGFGLAAELPIGVGLQFARAPIDLNLELIPTLQLIDGGGLYTELDIGAALNFRYYF